MHCCCMVFTKEFPTQAVLDKTLEPFNSEDVYDQPEESRVHPAFTWDWWTVGGRYAGKLKLKVEKESERVDCALCDDVENLREASCYCAVDCDGNAFSRESWDGHEWKRNADFEDQIAKIKNECAGCYVCVVDLHD